MEQRQQLKELLQMMAQLAQLAHAGGGGGGDSSDNEDETPSDVKSLHLAAGVGDVRRCQSLLRRGVDASATNKKGVTALHLAAARNRHEVVKELLRLGAKVDAVDEDGDTPLIFAVLQSHADMVELLLERGASVELCNNSAKTAADVALGRRCLAILYMLEGYSHCLQFDADLHADTLTSAAQDGDSEVLEFWLDSHPDAKICDYRLGDDRTLAFVAALYDRVDVLQLLDSKGADFEIADNRCHTPLFCAAQDGHLQVAVFLVGRGCDVNHRNVFRRTPLFSAVGNGHADVVQLLIDNGADVNHEDEQSVTPLELAIKEGQAAIFESLLTAGARIDHVNESNGFDYAMVAAHADRLPLLRRLGQRGLSLTATNRKSGSTALLAACQVGNEEMARFLLQCGSDKDRRNNNGVSPALRAAYNGHAGVLRLLGDAGAQLDLPDKDKDTAALCAALNGSLEIVKYLHGKGCRMDAKNKLGHTLAWHAAKKDCAELLRFLREVDAPMDEADKSGDTPLMLAVRKKASAEVVRLLLQFGCSAERQNRQGESPIDVARREGRREILEALGVEEPRRERPELQLRASLPAEAGAALGQLDPDFKTWNLIYDDEKKKQPIGAGGFGKVYKAYTDRHQFVAVKIVHAGGADPRRLERAIAAERKGMEILRQLRHPNIMTFLRCELNAKGQFCIFTELIAGVSLSDLMKKQGQPLNELGIRKFSLQICSALNHLHTRKPAILHRDIKCSNIMITHEGVIKLIDFGLAKEVVATSAVYTTESQCGTICFMAPELLHEDHDEHWVYSPKSDVWAFGCCLFEMATGRAPLCHLRQVQIIRAVLRDPMPTLPVDMSAAAREFYDRCLVKLAASRADTDELMTHQFLSQQQQ